MSSQASRGPGGGDDAGVGTTRNTPTWQQRGRGDMTQQTIGSGAYARVTSVNRCTAVQYIGRLCKPTALGVCSRVKAHAKGLHAQDAGMTYTNGPFLNSITKGLLCPATTRTTGGRHGARNAAALGPLSASALCCLLHTAAFGPLRASPSSSACPNTAAFGALECQCTLLPSPHCCLWALACTLPSSSTRAAAFGPLLYALWGPCVHAAAFASGGPYVHAALYAHCACAAVSWAGMITS